MDDREKIARALVSPEIQDNPLAWIVPPGEIGNRTYLNEGAWRTVLAMANAALLALHYGSGEFDVDIERRLVTHRPSGIVYWFEEYHSQEQWENATPPGWRRHGNPAWSGDRKRLAAAAKAMALAAGMPHRKEPKRGGDGPW